MKEKPTAGWALSPVVEREIAEERRARVARRRVGWALALSLLTACPFSCVSYVVSSEVSVAWWTALVGPIALFVFGAEMLRRNRRAAGLRICRKIALYGEYPAVDGWIVEMTVYQGAAPTGRDFGSVWFEEDRMYFSGYRTSFGLLACDVVGAMRETSPIDDLRSSLTMGLRQRTEAGPVSVGFDMILPPHSSESKFGAEARFGYEWRRWASGGGPDGEQGPPLAFGPDASSRRRLLLRAVAGSSFWCFAVYASVSLAFSSGWFAIYSATLLIALAAFSPEVWAPVLRWRAWRDRRRLDVRARQNNQQ